VNLRVVEREDIDFIAEHDGDINGMGEYWSMGEQMSKAE